jgi:hypothetical protein
MEVFAFMVAFCLEQKFIFPQLTLAALGIAVLSPAMCIPL